MNRPLISIIVPVLNESVLLGAFLQRLRAAAPDAEVIVVDGGSDDDTLGLSVSLADRVLRCARGRAKQMNAGAAVARGAVLWFLHADSVIPGNALEEITRVLRDDRNAGGCFRLRLPGKERIYRVSDSLGNIGVRVFGFALGDHGIFCRRRAFFDAGQFPDVPLMEDAELYRALWRSGRMRQLSAAITGNQRRYEGQGLYRTTAYYILILGLYLAGARISTLMAAYRRLNRDGHAKVPQPYSTSRAGLDSVTALSRSTTAPLGLRQ